MFSSVRIAIRSLARRPGLLLVAVVSLAVGIGVNSTVFTIVDAVYLRPPAVSDPQSLVAVYGNFKDSGNASLDWDDYGQIAAQVPAFSSVTVSMGRGGLWKNGGDATLLLVDAVGDNYFEMLGVKPFLGRLPDSKYDYAADPEPPIVVAYWFWNERMGGRPDIIGRRMEFRDQVWRVAAVLPPHFRGLSSMDQRHVWIPMSAWSRYFRDDLQRGSGQFEAVARLRPGVPLQQVQTQLDLVARRLEAADSRVTKGRRLMASSIGQEMRKNLIPGLLVMAVVGLVLLVACANVAAVLLAQAESRRREIGLRLSLGATRLALVRQFLTESALLAFAGSALGLLLVNWTLSAVPALSPPSEVPLKFDFRMDMRLLLFTAAAAMFTLFAFGLAPLTYALRVWPSEAISGVRIVGRPRRSCLRNTLVGAQVALSVVLVGGAFVLVRALSEAGKIYPGYDTSRRLALMWATPTNDHSPDVQLYAEALDRIAATGGVRDVTYARHLPLVGSGSGATLSVAPEGAAPDAPPARIYFNLVGPRFFEVMGVRMASGRIFTDADHHSAAPVAILNTEAARRFWPGQNPVGKILRIRNDAYQVAGIMVDGRIGGLHEQPAPVIYLPASRMRWGETILIARTHSDPAPMVKDMARRVAQTGALRVYQSAPLSAVMRQALYEDWIPTVLGGALAIVGLLLATGGLYGAASYATERRLSEFGVRVAVGARTSDIAGLVFRQSTMLCAAGVPAGILIFVAVYRFQAAVLLRGRPLDPLALFIGAAVTTVTVLAGTVVPAMRAARVDPVRVLRAE